jgi:hypothetical protein
MTKVFRKRQKLEKVGQKTKLLSLCGKRQKYSTKIPPFHYTFAGVEVSCCSQQSQLDSIDFILRQIAKD